MKGRIVQWGMMNDLRIVCRYMKVDSDPIGLI